MAVRNVARNLFAICLLSTFLSASAQIVSPQNGTLLVPLSLPQLKLTSTQTIMSTSINVDPLTQYAGLNASVQALGDITYQGTLILTDSTNANKLATNSMAYISCDPSAYTGNLNAASVVRAAAIQISGPDVKNPLGAIILYSTVSDFCQFDPAGFQYPWVFTTVNSTSARILETALQSPSPAGSTTTIKLDQSSLNNTDSGNALGPSPTTAVAMIILYSITGIITALFLIIIVTGAIRAHRHPERYGPRNVVGRPRQSRAKGIARAMLETLPIVKFGETEDAAKPMPVPGDDLELGEANHSPANQARETGPSSTQGGTSAGPTDEGMDIVKTVTVKDDASSHDHKHNESEEKESMDGDGHEHAAGDSHYHPNVTEGSDNGLACSVCTDDFVKGQDIRVLPCGHKFHPECIDPWLLNVSGTCPLCRIDLRPTASHTEGEDGPMPMPMPDMADMPEGDDMPPEMAATETGRRRHNGLALYLQHTLNVRRMRDATPEERIAALRRFRTARRATNGDMGDSMPMPMPVGARARMTARLNRLWPRSVHGASESTMPESGISDHEAAR